MLEVALEIVLGDFAARLDLLDVTAIGTLQRFDGRIEIELRAAILARELAARRRRFGHRRRFFDWSLVRSLLSVVFSDRSFFGHSKSLICLSIPNCPDN
jgi:hypothetical protein